MEPSGLKLRQAESASSHWHVLRRCFLNDGPSCCALRRRHLLIESPLRRHLGSASIESLLDEVNRWLAVSDVLCFVDAEQQRETGLALRVPVEGRVRHSKESSILRALDESVRSFSVDEDGLFHMVDVPNAGILGGEECVSTVGHVRASWRRVAIREGRLSMAKREILARCCVSFEVLIVPVRFKSESGPFLPDGIRAALQSC